MLKHLLVFFVSLSLSAPAAAIPATEVMTLYRFNDGIEVPYYSLPSAIEPGKLEQLGSLAQGSAVIPCLAMHRGRPLTRRSGTPLVGFELVMDSRRATPQSVAQFKRRLQQRRVLKVPNHHCDRPVTRLLDATNLYRKTAGPLFEPAVGPVAKPLAADGELDRIVRAFHNSAQCAGVNRRVTGRRAALAEAWDAFVAGADGRWPDAQLQRARDLDYTMRTALFEGHLGRGCDAYGSCERNAIALSIRNRARGSCLKYQGCRFPGDFQGVASAVSQYNIWDEYLTQISGLTSCFLRDDLAEPRAAGVQTGKPADYYARLQAMYRQNRADVERILFGPDSALGAIFPGSRAADLAGLRHYYHPPAMGKCFPRHPRVEYVTGAVARNGADYALIVNRRVEVGEAAEGGYYFQLFDVDSGAGHDRVALANSYPGFVIDGRKVELKPPRRCAPYGTPRGCKPTEPGWYRKPTEPGWYRKTPSWLAAGRPLRLHCRVEARGQQCREAGVGQLVQLGGRCDRQMQPVTGVY